MLAKFIIGTMIFLFGGAAIHQGLTMAAKSEVAPTPAAIVESAVQSSDEPQFVVRDYAVIVCFDGSDVTIDKTEPVLLVVCGE